MIPDVLISKYLDGELSRDEDIQFRAMLGADPEAREAFDAAVLVHIAMRCEDDTRVPFDVEERVLSFIDNVPMYAQSAQILPIEKSWVAEPQGQTTIYDGNAQSSTVKGLKSRGLQTRRFLAAAALLLVLALPIGEQIFQAQTGIVSNSQTNDMQRRGSQDDLRAVQSTNHASLKHVTPASENSSKHVQGSESQPLLAANVSQPPVLDASEPMIASTTPRAVESQSIVANRMPVISNRSIEAYEQGSRAVPPSLHSIFTTTEMTVNLSAAAQADKTPTLTVEAPAIDVLVTTSYAQSVAAPTEGAVTTVAAGIGYGVAENTFVGMELGSTQYSRTNQTLSLPTPSDTRDVADWPPSQMARQDRTIRLTKATVESNVVPQYQKEIHTSLSPEGTLWGAAFIQHSILKTGIMSVHGRLGAGVGEDGMLTYGRMQAECTLFASVSLTVGAEARYSPFRTGVVGGQPLARTYGTVISALYGLQVRL